MPGAMPALRHREHARVHRLLVHCQELVSADQKRMPSVRRAAHT